MDSDVTLLQSYAAYITGLGGDISAVASNASTLAIEFAGVSASDQALAQAIEQSAGNIPLTAIPLYASELQQAATQLSTLLTDGTQTTQAQGAPAVLGDIATWLLNVHQKLIGLASSITTLRNDVNTDQGALPPDAAQVVTALSAAYQSVYGSITPVAAATQLNRIAARINTLLQASGSGGGGGIILPPNHPVGGGGGTTTSRGSSSSSNTLLYVGAAAAVVGTFLWLASRGRPTKQPTPRRRVAR